MYNISLLILIKLANKRYCKPKYSVGLIRTCKNVTKLPSSVPIIRPMISTKKIGCLSARNKNRYNSKANTIIATIARPKFKYLFTTQIDIDPAKKKIKVCTTSYIESIPITDGVKILL